MGARTHLGPRSESPWERDLNLFLCLGLAVDVARVRMSLLPPEVHAALSQLLGALGTPDNNVRSQAEEQLNNDWIQNRPDVLLMGLAEQLEGAEETVVSNQRYGGVTWR